MKLIICSVYDSATEAYMRPWMAQAPAQALRMFQDEAVNPETPIAQHPEDYSLFQIGTFTDHNGEITPMEPVCLARAHEVKAQAATIHKMEAN